MKRRTFIKNTSASAFMLSVFPVEMLFATEFLRDELIGKGNPKLYGGKSINLRKEAHDAFLQMKTAAAKENINIKIVSSYRNFNRQKAIWERKYKKFTSEGLSPMAAIKKIIEYSTIPGTSRHHWGTDIDIIDANATYSGDVLISEKFHGNGPFCKLKDWLDKNVNHFNFHIVYTDDGNRKGFKYEPWHYSYAPLSKPMLKAYKKLNIKKILLEEEKLMGSEHFTDEFIQSYINQNILGINPELL